MLLDLLEVAEAELVDEAEAARMATEEPVLARLLASKAPALGPPEFLSVLDNLPSVRGIAPGARGFCADDVLTAEAGRLDSLPAKVSRVEPKGGWLGTNFGSDCGVGMGAAL